MDTQNNYNIYYENRLTWNVSWLMVDIDGLMDGTKEHTQRRGRGP